MTVRNKILGTAAAFTLCTPLSAVSAQPLQFFNIANTLSFVDLGLEFQAIGLFTGYNPDEDVVVHLDASANETVSCVAPGGHTPPPFRFSVPTPVTVSGTEIVTSHVLQSLAGPPGSQPGSYQVTTQPPITPIPGAPDCPSRQFTENVSDLAFTSATLTLFQQDEPTAVLNCLFQPTSNGIVTGAAGAPQTNNCQ